MTSPDKPRLTKHERLVRQAVSSMVKNGEGPVSVNLRKNPGLRDWVQKTPGVKGMK